MDEGHVGERIRQLRRARRLTLQYVAHRSGLSIGFLSLAERQLTGITLTSLVNVARALNVPLQELVRTPEANELNSVSGKRPRYSVANNSPTYERLSSAFPKSKMHSVKVQVPANYKSEVVFHAGEEFVIVMAGVVQYRIDSQAYSLSVGDTVHFDARRPHSVEVIGDIPAELIWVGTLDIFFGPGRGQGVRSINLRGTEFDGLRKFKSAKEGGVSSFSGKSVRAGRTHRSQ